MVLKLARITLAKSPFQTPISAAHSSGLARRSRTQRSNREGDPAISGAISDRVRGAGMSSLLAYLTTQAQRPGPREAWIATGARWPGSLQRMVVTWFVRLHRVVFSDMPIQQLPELNVA